ncbi:hypothetical protein F3Y22_tig00116975pilonHSYRG00173 [Hibiscus syriacus]|uniref:K Homology domain-containing protein n=1 Tax=Hibiscus syriacus TaxID=106335 RepID=A0A6A2WR49_HIBSY|nr:hypothetical protein F3Y22_tig00116975pilonHSYRG00173 [Hibiscus syriacus]
MADEAQYTSGLDVSSNKRKYDDEAPLPSGVRRPTGFSSPDSAPPSYNSVPPPLDGIEMAKQRAQEIAARLTASVACAAAETKRPRIENGSGGGFDYEKGFSSAPSDIKPLSNSAPSAIPVSYGSYHGSSKKIDIPQNRVGVIIGKAGETIKYLQLQSGAKIQVQRDLDADPNSMNRPVELVGTAEQISKAEQLINDVLVEAEAGGSGMVSRRMTGQAGSEHFEMKIPCNKVGLVIGKGGETIKSMQARTGARIQVIPLHLPPGDTSTERTLHIDGTSEQIKHARELVDEVTSENRMRNQTMAGGYPQQGGYEARPPSSWGQGAPPMQQPGYGYMQPGAYPGQSPQCNMSQPPYGGYPSQPSSGGYASGWDQSSVPPNQQSSGASGYDYYNQQPSSQQQQNPGDSATPANNSGYNYGQPPASNYMQPGQGYSQGGYGGYHGAPQSGYGQPSSYDQQGYGHAPSYANATILYKGIQARRLHLPNHLQWANKEKPLTNPPVYGQAQQSPSTPGSYGQPGYHSQPPSSGYGQPSSYGAPYAQPGYGAPSYGAAAANQPGYGAPYNTSYGGSYSQPSTYPADENASGGSHGTYEAAPATKTGEQGGTAKASPQS